MTAIRGIGHSRVSQSRSVVSRLALIATFSRMASSWTRVTNSPITQKNHPYETSNISLQRRIQITEKTALKIRFDVVNILDKIYELRDGSGIGVGAPQFGQRRGFYGTISYDF
jgi:outer membrane receptor protein involved in Fe transport